MKRSKEENSIILIFVIFFVILAGICIYGIGKLYGPILVPDEVGYWAHAANFLGYDWKDVMSIHSYYSYGYGILMTPFLYFIEDTILLYRVMIVINFLLLFGGMILLYRIIIKIMPDIERKLVAVLSGITMLYSSHIVYVQTTMSEVLLVFLFLALTELLIRYLERPTVSRMMAAVFLMTYMYIVHMRTIGVVIAGLIILLFPLVIKKENIGKTILLLMIVVMIAIVVTAYKSGYVESISQRSKSGINASNDYKGQINNILFVFSVKGIFAFVAGFLGKIFYLGSATFGLFYWGLFSVFSMLKKSIKEYKEVKVINSGLVSAFFLLAVIFTLSISTIFNIKTTRLDAVMYGRYNEHILSMFLILGLIQILNAQKLKKGTWVIVCIQSICCIAVNQIIELNSVEGMYRHSIVGVAYVLQFAKGRLYNITFLIHLCGCVLTIAVALIAFMAKKLKITQVLCAVILILQIAIGFYTCKDMVYAVNQNNYSNVLIAREIRELGKEKREIKYIYSYVWARLDLLQYCLQDVQVHLIQQDTPDISMLSETDVVVTGKEAEYNALLTDKYTDYMESNHYSIYYNSYIGE